MKSAKTLEIPLGLDKDTLIVKAFESKRSKKINYMFYLGNMSNKGTVYKLSDSAKVDMYIYLQKAMETAFKLAIMDLQKTNDAVNSRLANNIWNEMQQKELVDKNKILKILEEEPCIKSLSQEFVDYWAEYFIGKQFSLFDLINMRMQGYEYGDYLFKGLYEHIDFKGSITKDDMLQYLQNLNTKCKLVNQAIVDNYNPDITDVYEQFRLVHKDLRDELFIVVDSDNALTEEIHIELSFTEYQAVLSGINFNYQINNYKELKFDKGKQISDFKNVKFNSNLSLVNNLNKVFGHVMICKHKEKIMILFVLLDQLVIVPIYEIIITDKIETWIAPSVYRNYKNTINEKLVINPETLCGLICEIYDSFYSRHKKYNNQINIDSLVDSALSETLEPSMLKQSKQSLRETNELTITIKHKDFNIDDMDLTEFIENNEDFVKSMRRKHVNHKSPIPHYRSPHTRTSKNGIVSHIEGTMVNKDKLKDNDFVNYTNINKIAENTTNHFE